MRSEKEYEELEAKFMRVVRALKWFVDEHERAARTVYDRSPEAIADCLDNARKALSEVSNGKETP
jgi:hypothetical protein